MTGSTRNEEKLTSSESHPPRDHTSVSVFRPSRFAAVVLMLVSLLFAALLIFKMSEFVSENPSFKTVSECLILFAFFAAPCLYAFYLHTLSVTILETAIEKRSFLGSESLSFSDCKGVHLVEGKIEIVPQIASAKKLSIPLGLVAQEGDMLELLICRLKDLTPEDYEREVDALLAKPEFGRNPEELAKTLQKARRLGKYLEGVAIGVAGWLIFYPHPNSWPIWTAAVVPLATLLATRLFPGLYAFGGEVRAVRPSLVLPLLSPSVALLLRAVLDWKILSWDSFWIPALLVGALLWLAMALCFSSDLRKLENIVLMLFVVAVYGYGVTINFNGILDSSEVVSHSAKVLQKCSSGKRSCTITLAPWGSRTTETELTVASPVCSSVLESDQIFVLVHKGAFGIPWYSVSPGKAK